jgi:drug/metabolite transporter (DMT)-like permease
MITGILSGFLAAFLNAVAFLFSARFLKKYNSSRHLLVSAHIVMLGLCFPAAFFLYPGKIIDLSRYLFYVAAWCAVFFSGQFSFFAALKHIEASRLSSLLGLKLIVLTVIFMITARTFPGIWQWLAIIIAAAAAVMINWSGNSKVNFKGGVFLLLTLICYSFSDICETGMVKCMLDSDHSPLRSAFFATSVAYIVLGIAILPGLLKVKITKEQLFTVFPYSCLWVVSQAFLMICFAKVAPVFGNVILSSRGLFSVILGAFLVLVTGSKLDADISSFEKKLEKTKNKHGGVKSE